MSFKTRLKNSTQTIFQGGSLDIPSDLVFFRYDYDVQTEPFFESTDYFDENLSMSENMYAYLNRFRLDGEAGRLLSFAFGALRYPGISLSDFCGFKEGVVL